MDPLNVTIVFLLFAFVALVEWIDRRNLIARWLDRARVRYGRQLPLGCHRIEGPVGIHFGQDDATLVFGIPLQESGRQRPLRYVGSTDAQTRFTVDDVAATPDELLAAYDDSLGPLTIQVYELGRIAEIGIAQNGRKSDERTSS